MSITSDFEQELRRRLLDVVYSQWRDLGVPFTADLRAAEIIDPEALLWCSLEFLPTEPRLCEGVLSWLAEHKNDLIRQRLNKRASGGDPRASIWRVLIKGQPPLPPEEPCHGFDAPADVIAFCKRLSASLASPHAADSRLGKPAAGPSTALLRARNLLGSDIRHFLLVYLLGSPGGGRLRTVQQWASYTYRSVSETASRWESAHAATIDHGDCRLNDPNPWRELLRLGTTRPVVVDWFVLFDACIYLLRVLAKAARKGFPADSPVVTIYRRDARAKIRSSALNGEADSRGAIVYLSELFPDEDGVRATA